MSSHPDRQFTSYILSGIETGFRVGFNRDQPLHSVSKNCPSADAHPKVITEYIKEEAAAERFLDLIVEDQAQFVHISKFGIILKGHVPSKWRLITDLSFPAGLSVNDGINVPICLLTLRSTRWQQWPPHWGWGLSLQKSIYSQHIGLYQYIPRIDR